MSYRPFLTNTSFNESTNTVTVEIEHRNTASVIVRTYEFPIPTPLATIKNTIKAANTALRDGPAIIDTLDNLKQSEIT